METVLHHDKTFENINYSGKEIKDREFEKCIFKNCDLSNSNLTSSKFIDCTFILCNLSMMKLNNSQFDTVAFTDCKMLGVDFSKCTDFAFSAKFTNCILEYACFERKKMTTSLFVNSNLKGADFTEADLSKLKFNNCDLLDAVFVKTILKETNFTTAYNFIIDPEKNTMKKAKFSTQSLAGLLHKYDLRIE